MIKDENIRGIVFDIQHFAVHDGPGIRTLVFLKGCNLRCEWCENPEGLEVGREIIYVRGSCIGDQACIDVCPEGAIKKSSSTAKAKVEIVWEKCTECLRCAEVCTPQAIRIVGTEMRAGAVMKDIMEDTVFYRGIGGVTLSGGEPVMQKEFSIAILRLSKRNGINTALETNGSINREDFKEILEFVDHLLIDVKHIDPHIHKKYTGVSNEVILSNLEAAVPIVPDTAVRVPVIPAFNMNGKDLLKIAEVVASMGIHDMHLLPYHTLGSSKCENMGKPYRFKTLKSLCHRDVLPFKEMIEKKTGMRVKIGG